MYLLDTNVISESTKSRPSPKVEAWMEAAAAATLFVSVISIGEVVKGIELLPPGTRRRKLASWLDHISSVAFADRVLPVDTAAAAAWGRIEARLRRSLPRADTLIAATAYVRGLTVATRNERDFAALGVRVVNPWA